VEPAAKSEGEDAAVEATTEAKHRHERDGRRANKLIKCGPCDVDNLSDDSDHQTNRQTQQTQADTGKQRPQTYTQTFKSLTPHPTSPYTLWYCTPHANAHGLTTTWVD
jgi:hypothetical protein